MSFRKIPSIRVSEAVMEPVCDELDMYRNDYGVKIDGYLETFNNCREQGFCLFADSVDWDNPKKTMGMIHIFACEARSSDHIMIICQTEFPGNKGMFSDEAYDNYIDEKSINPIEENFCFRTYFAHNERQKASKFIVDTVKKFLKEEFSVLKN